MAQKKKEWKTETYETVEIENLVTIIDHNAVFFWEPPRPSANQGRQGREDACDVEEELGNMEAKDMSHKVRRRLSRLHF